MKTTLLILTAMLIAGSVDAAGAKKGKAQDAFGGNAVPTTKERMKVDAQEKKCENPIDKFVSTPGSVAEFELAYGECPTNAIVLYRARAEAGDSRAQYFMAVALLRGVGCQKDEKASFEWAKKSAKGEFAPAIALLGCYYRGGVGVEKDVITAFEMFEKAANMGSVKAKLRLGELYMAGSGCAKDESKGRMLMEEAANNGLVEAMISIGELDDDRKWFRKAMEAGDFRSRLRFAETWYKHLADAGADDLKLVEQIYLETAEDEQSILNRVEDGDFELDKLGRFKSLSDARIARFYVVIACLGLGDMMEKGLGGHRKNLVAALDYYERAGRLGRKDAQRTRSILESQYDKETIATMRKRLHQNTKHVISNGRGKDGVAKSDRLLSFCGIKFGDELSKTPVLGDQRTKDGKSLMRTVKLQKPFQGMDHATVFASVKTRKICCVQLEWTKEGLNDDEVPEGKSIVNAVRNRYPDAEKIAHDMPDGFMNLYVEEYKVCGGKVSIEWVQRDFMYPPTRLQLTARNDEFMRLAEEEYNQESGGDGSSVL